MSLTFGLDLAENDWWWAVDNIRVFVPADPSKLRIDTGTGHASIVGGDVIPASINYIDITSTNGVLNGAELCGLEHHASPTRWTAPIRVRTVGDSSGEYWQSLSATNNRVTEAFLLGSSTFTDTRTEFLGRFSTPATPVGTATSRLRTRRSSATSSMASSSIAPVARRPASRAITTTTAPWTRPITCCGATAGRCRMKSTIPAYSQRSRLHGLAGAIRQHLGQRRRLRSAAVPEPGTGQIALPGAPGGRGWSRFAAGRWRSMLSAGRLRAAPVRVSAALLVSTSLAC